LHFQATHCGAQADVLKEARITAHAKHANANEPYGRTYSFDVSTVISGFSKITVYWGEHD